MRNGGGRGLSVGCATAAGTAQWLREGGEGPVLSRRRGRPSGCASAGTARCSRDGGDGPVAARVRGRPGALATAATARWLRDGGEDPAAAHRGGNRERIGISAARHIGTDR
ncbi:hypothetical protein GCM10010434_024840 [Winogradskya humida]